MFIRRYSAYNPLALLGVMLFAVSFGLSCKRSGDDRIRMKEVSAVAGGGSPVNSGGEGLPSSDQPVPANDMERRIQEKGLVSVRSVVPSIRVDLRYTTEDNFVGVDLYGEMENCYLQPEVAEKLKLAQLFLRNRYPSYSLVVFDGVRPLSVQEMMWDSLDAPINEKRRFLADPGTRSMHNFGAAVDVSIVDQYGEQLDMGTPFDHRGELAYPRKEKELLKKGKLTEEQMENRLLLREVMTNAGFSPITTEWWHFSTGSRREAARRFSLVE